jgi:hypothetical protein
MMSTPKEVTIKIRGEDKILTHKFLIYEDFVMHPDDEEIAIMIEEASKDYRGEIESIQVIVKMEIVQ